MIFEADTTFGWVPFDVNFTASSGLQVDTWTWDFGDGDSSYVQSPVHSYEEPGLYTVKAEISAGGKMRSRVKTNYIKALADSLIGTTAEGNRSATVKMPVYAHNNVPVTTIKIPVQYSGDLDVTLDSFSTVGCRTDYFEEKTYLHFDPTGKKKTIKLVSSYSGSSPDLPAGAGIVANLYFTISASAGYGDTTSIDIDGYSGFDPEFAGQYANYKPRVTGGVLFFCAPRGDLDDIPGVSVSDLTFLVDYLFFDGVSPSLPGAADVNCSGGINVSDLAYLVKYLFESGPEPCGC